MQVVRKHAATHLTLAINTYQLNNNAPNSRIEMDYFKLLFNIIIVNHYSLTLFVSKLVGFYPILMSCKSEKILVIYRGVVT